MTPPAADAVMAPMGRGAVTWGSWPVKERPSGSARAGRAVLLFLCEERSFWCRELARDVFTDADLVRDINRLTVPVWVDVDERPDLAERYSLGAYPSLAFLTPEGTWISGTTFVEKDDFDRLLRRVSIFFEVPERRLDLERERVRLHRRLSQTRPRRREAPGVALLSKVREALFAALREGSPLSPEAATLLAVSGAPDSTVRAAFGFWLQEPPGLLEGLLPLGDLSGDGRMVDPEVNLAASADRIRALAFAGGATGRPEFVDRARAGADGLDRLFLEESRAFAAGFAGFGSPDTAGAVTLPGDGEPTGLDTRTITGWNALAASALLALSGATGEGRYGQRAAVVLDGLLAGRVDEGGSVARLPNGDGPHFLEDAALLARACLDAAEAGHDRRFQDAAIRVTDRVLQSFPDPSGALRDRFPEPATAVLPWVDRAVPSANGVMAQVLVRLSRTTGEARYRRAAQGILRALVAPGLDRAHRAGALAAGLSAYVDAGTGE